MFRRDITENSEPIRKNGIENRALTGIGYQGHRSATEFTNLNRLAHFTLTTVIINGGYAEWVLKIPEEIRSELIDATLRIETIRAHGMLHSPIQYKSARILINGNLVDDIVLVRLLPQGTDYGVDTSRSIPVLDFIDRGNKDQTIRIEVDRDAYWDIDRITLMLTVKRNEWMPFGASVLSAVFGVLGGRSCSILRRRPLVCPFFRSFLSS